MEPNKTKNYAVKISWTIITSILFLLSACSSAEEDSGQAKENRISVKAETVSSVPVAGEITFSGNVEGITTVELGFMVPGKIDRITKKVGQFVSKGQQIASLETTTYDLSEQLAGVQLKETNDEYTRLKFLHSRGSLSDSEFSKISTSLEKAQLQQKLEAKNLRDTHLYAPINGILLSKQVEVGEIIAAGSPLFVIADIRKISILAFVPEGELNGLHIGQDATINVVSLNKVFKGKITEMGALADAASRAFTVKITVENSGLQIRPGMIAEARIGVSGQKTGITLPTESIINDLGNQSYVYVADKSSQKAFKRKVSLGKMIANNIEIKSGLSVGETVIVSGQTKLSDGALISLEK